MLWLFTEFLMVFGYGEPFASQVGFGNKQKNVCY
jgi:hypothetical protein